MPKTKINGGNACYLGGLKEFHQKSEISDDVIDKMIDSYLNRWDPYDYGR